jgi:hypothetical protein
VQLVAQVVQRVGFAFIGGNERRSGRRYEITVVALGKGQGRAEAVDLVAESWNAVEQWR